MSLQQIVAENTPGKMQPISTTPTKNNSVPSVPRMTSSAMKSVQSNFTTPLQSMSESNTPPLVFAQNNVRYDQIMDTLLDAGYNIEHRMYDGKTLTHLLATTILGDRVLIKVDSPQYRATFPKLHSHESDIEMEHRSNITLIPQEIKMGTLQCLNYDICGAAFVCNGNICTSERFAEADPYQIVKQPSEKEQFVEHQFIFKTPTETLDSATVLDRTAVAYPIVKLSDILKQPQAYVSRIAKINSQIVNNSADLLSQQNKQLLNEVQKVQNDVMAMGSMMQEILANLNNEIEALTQTYQSFADVNPNELADSVQAEYYLTLKTLAQKKDIRRDLLNAVSKAYDASQPVKSVPQHFRAYVDPVLGAYEKSQN